VVRQFVKPVNPNTPRQVDVRVALDTLSSDWSNTLTEAQRDGWIDYARNTPLVNKSGAPKFLSGRMMWIRTGFIPQFINGTTAGFTAPPSTPGIANIKTPAFTYASATGLLKVTAVAAGQPTAYKNIALISRNLAPSRNFWKGPFNFTTSWDFTAVFPLTIHTVPGTITPGDKVFVQIRTFDETRNKVSQPFIYEVIAT
jgi:hypothetical protein